MTLKGCSLLFYLINFIIPQLPPTKMNDIDFKSLRSFENLHYLFF